ncbi:MAG TPA: hypothetical protein VLJ80_05370 [Solirubrobacteraceae bacterium]|nr:hypothetical protein [Solirubrobacteraceae bacterium]
MPEPTHILMVGLPESGKTTYLAALYHTLRSVTGEQTSMRLRQAPAERQYFHEIEEIWLRFEPMPRSQHREPAKAGLELLDPSGEEIDLEIPDVSGETFDALWESGVWVESLRALASSAVGVLLFTRADRVDYPELITVEDPDQPESEGVAPRAWEPSDAPTQTKLVDLLETVWSVGENLRVAVAVSAWDRVAAEGLAPDQWLELNLPLLWQMLQTNGDAHPWRAFGVSAQGGDLEDPEARLALAKCDPPGSRVMVRDGDDSHDLTRPLSWLLANRT